MKKLITQIKQCRICATELDHEPRPIVQIDKRACILIAGQAPGRKVHETGIPFNDLSGVRLREWMGVSETIFYDAKKIVLLPMGFCYPGQGKSGDLPPRKECADTWREQVMNELPNIKLTLAIGKYAIKWHLGEKSQRNLTETVKAWETYSPEIMPLPHPSPRNNIWLKKNTWFETELLPVLRSRVKEVLTR